MTYNVFGGTLALLNQSIKHGAIIHSNATVVLNGVHCCL